MATTFLMKVHNNTTHAMNAPAQGGYGISADAVGGAKAYALPYPFSHTILAPTGTTLVVNGITYQDYATLPVHVEDMRYKSVPWLPMEPSREWMMLVQTGDVTITFETGGAPDLEETLIAKSQTV